MRIFRAKKPIVAAVHGAAIGGGLGLALAADFRVTCPEARFAANFTKLGFHPGFGLTATLPELVGKNNAELIFYTSRRVTGEEATRMGLANVCVPQDQVRAEAMKLAAEIAECSPLGLLSTRATMRAGLADRVLAATNHELAEQTRLRATEDFKEGVKATERTPGRQFQGAVIFVPPCGVPCASRDPYATNARVAQLWPQTPSRLRPRLTTRWLRGPGFALTRAGMTI